MTFRAMFQRTGVVAGVVALTLAKFTQREARLARGRVGVYVPPPTPERMFDPIEREQFREQSQE